MYTRSGTFRRFAFIGYSDTFSAQESIKYFNDTYIGTSKIQVIEAKSFGDSSIPRPWSRYSTGSSTNQSYEKKRKPTKDSCIGEEGQKEEEEEVERKSKRLKLNEDFHQSQLASLVNELEELKSEPGFMEFLAANERGRSSETWTNEGKGKLENDKKKRKEVEINQDEDNNCKRLL